MVLHFLKEQGRLRTGGKLPLDRIAVIILGGGEGTRLQPLTKARCKPAVSFGGRYTLIDIPISHALMTGIGKIYVLGQYMAHSLEHHLAKSYQPLLQKELQLLLPQDGNYEGTADAVRKNLDLFAQIQADYFLILSGDQLYNIDFEEMLQFGITSKASMVIASQWVEEKEATRMGLLKLESGSTLLKEFVEKPKEKVLLERFRREDGPQKGKEYLGSMGIYFFQREALFNLLLEDQRADFGAHLIGTELKKGSIHSYIYNGYWEDIGTIASYYHANLALTRGYEHGGFDCYDERNVIMTQSYHLPGAKVVNCRAQDSLFCEGAIIEAAEVSHSIVGVRAQVGKEVILRDTILMGNSYYERPLDGDIHSPVIGEGSIVTRAILDENVTLGRNVRLVNQACYHHYDHPAGLLYVRDGITIVPSKTILPDFFAF